MVILLRACATNSVILTNYTDRDSIATVSGYQAQAGFEWNY